MLIVSYEEWKTQKQRAWSEDNPKIDCPKCEGEGEIYDTCPCCGHDTDDECQTCDGEGRLHFRDLDALSRSNYFTRRMYQKEVIADLKQWCAYTREDFLQVAGGFVNEFRNKQRGV